jgi:hypothetical protein
MSTRTLFIAIRAIQYTDRATKQVADNIDKLITKQDSLRKQTAIANIAGGIMWTALGVMASSAIMGIMRTSSAGARVMNQFDRALSQLSKSFGKAFTEVLGPVIKALTGLFTWISKLPPQLLQFIAAGALAGVTFITLKGATMLLTGALTYFNIIGAQSNVMYANMVGGQLVLATTTKGTAMAFTNLGTAISASVGVFSMFLMIGMQFKGVASIIVAAIGIIITALSLYRLHLAGAITLQSMLSPWMVPIMAGAGLAAGALASNLGGFEIGTRRVQRTGPAIVHAGEMVGTERGLKAQIGGKGAGAPEKNQVNATINFSGNIQTKADKEELRPLILKVIKEALDNKV